MADGITNAPSGDRVKPVGLSVVSVSTEISVPAAGNYAAEDVISNSTSVGTYLTFSNVAGVKGGSGTIVNAIVLCQTTDQAHRPTLLLFNAVPTSNLNDNVANAAPSWTDRTGYIGKIEFPAFADKGGISQTEVVPGAGGLPKPFVCGADSKDIYGICITEDAFTNETANDDYRFILLIAQD